LWVDGAGQEAALASRRRGLAGRRSGGSDATRRQRDAVAHFFRMALVPSTTARLIHVFES